MSEEMALSEVHTSVVKAPSPRKRGNQEYYANILDEKIKPEWGKIVDEMIKVALSEKMTREKFQALVYLIDRVLGRPVQQMDEVTDNSLNVNIRKVEARKLEDIGVKVSEAKETLLGVINGDFPAITAPKD